MVRTTRPAWDVDLDDFAGSQVGDEQQPRCRRIQGARWHRGERLCTDPEHRHDCNADAQHSAPEALSLRSVPWRVQGRVRPRVRQLG
jgi:hypothetical protein